MGILFIVVVATIAIGVIYLQLKYFRQNKNKIKDFREFFPFDSSNEITITNTFANIESDSYYVDLLNPLVKVSDEFNNVISKINKYLIRNKGAAADFELIKNIAERYNSSIEKNILNTISLPLYLGLMGTFLGTILGLIPFLFSGSNSSSLSNAIPDFLTGVILSMTASFVGLLLTTISNTKHFKNAKEENENRRNEFYSFLQTELLPIVNMDMANSLQSLKSNLDNFNNQFNDNIQGFGNNIKLINSNIDSQKELINAINKNKVSQIIEQNIKAYQNMIKVGDTFEKTFDLTEKLNFTINSTINMFNSIDSIYKKVENFDKNIESIVENIKESEIQHNIILSSVDQHIRDLNARRDTLIQHINISEDLVKGHVNQEEEEIKKISNSSLQKINEIVHENEIKMNELGNEFETAIHEANNKLTDFNKKLGSDLEEIKDKNILMKTEKNLLEIKDALIKMSKNKDVNVTVDLSSLELSIISLTNQVKKLNKKITPSIFQPVDFVKHIFKLNGFNN